MTEKEDSENLKVGFGVWLTLCMVVCFWFLSKFAMGKRQFQENLHVIEEGLKKMQEDMETRDQKSIGHGDDVEDISDFMRKFVEAGEQEVYRVVLSNRRHFFRKFCTSENPIITYEKDDKAVIILNRPKVHNCINASLACNLHESLKKFQDKSLIILKGAGNSYSSGGDLKWILEQFQKGTSEGTKMFIYHNVGIHTMATLATPCVALIDGYTMGGGVGLSKFCNYRVATERTQLAMPESLIGFHPNSGASYFYTRMKGKLGWYLAMTSRTLIGSDVVKAGFATHFCQSHKLNDLERELLNTPSSEVENVLSTFCDQDLPDFSLRDRIEMIDECFAASSVEEIFEKLELAGENETLDLLKKLSPTCLKVIFRQLQKGERISLRKCLNMEFSLSLNFLRFPDFPEGIRAKLIDRSNNPRWTYSTLSEVPDDIVEKHFEQQPGEEVQRKLLENMGDLL